MGSGIRRGGHDRQPASLPRVATSSTIAFVGISMPMCANGAMIGCGPLSWSRMKLTNTKMNGLSPWSGWPNHAALLVGVGATIRAVPMA